MAHASQLDRLVAHSANAAGVEQGLEEHLLNVAALAEQFAVALGEQQAARITGLLHDIAKARDSWRARLAILAAGGKLAWDEQAHDHKLTSALYAWNQGMLDVAQVIAGHHGGMLDFGVLRQKMEGGIYAPGLAEVQEKLAGFLHQVGHDNGGGRDFYRLLMLFSCLTDADSIDTSSHFRGRLPAKSDALALLNETLLNHVVPPTHASNGVLSLRTTIRRLALAAVSNPRGLFSLNAATGSGKTISGGLWALGHAAHHQMARIVYVAPYRSIIDQTAGIYKSIFGSENVLAHHSTSDFWSGREQHDSLQRQLAENWADISVVVTTAEQFFESPYSSRPGACRKLHNLVNSVIVIDEPQAIPLRFLQPCMRYLRALVEQFGCSALFMTATMPPLDRLLGTKKITPIANKINHRRVRIFKRRFDGAYPSDVAAFMGKHEQALCISNIRSGALAIYENLPVPSRVYISTYLCPAHRKDVIEYVRNRLGAGQACHVSSTQVIEAGVDFDFPHLVIREKAPLDSMIQAFGRCNRNGMGKGHCYIYGPAAGNQLPDYDAGIAVVNQLIAEGRNLHSPATMKRYYDLLYSKRNLDVADVMTNVQQLNFGAIREEFRLIAQNQVNVIVFYGEEQDKIQAAIDAVRAGLAQRQKAGKYRWALRYLQHYVVTLYPDKLARLQAAFPLAIEELFLNYYLWKGSYSPKTGLGNVVAATQTGGNIQQ